MTEVSTWGCNGRGDPLGCDITLLFQYMLSKSPSVFVWGRRWDLVLLRQWLFQTESAWCHCSSTGILLQPQCKRNCLWHIAWRRLSIPPIKFSTWWISAINEGVCGLFRINSFGTKESNLVSVPQFVLLYYNHCTVLYSELVMWSTITSSQTHNLHLKGRFICLKRSYICFL